MIYSHEGDPCIHCGSMHPEQHTFCVPRADPKIAGTMPEPSCRVFAVNDSDTISARIAELNAEREAAWNTVNE